jgi:hypothetical protein
MSKIEDIQAAIAALPPAEQERLREWLEELAGQRFDERIERDAHSGKLDKLIEQALAKHRAGRTTLLP